MSEDMIGTASGRGSDERTESSLRGPLRDHMRSPLTEADVQRLWRGVTEKRARASRPAARHLTTGLALAAALLASVLWFVPRSWMLGAPVGASPLTLASGGEIGLIEASAAWSAPAPFELSDGSVITLSPGARLSALESTDRTFSALLSAGRAEFNVKSGGPRRWSIECGVATVEVVGTRFVVDRSSTRVRVEVLEGVVLVRGERVPDRVRRLTPGESLEIADARGSIVPAVEPKKEAATGAEAATEAEAEAATEAATGAGAATEAEAEAAAAAAAATKAKKPKAVAGAQPATVHSRWREFAKRGDYKEAYQTLGAPGIRRESASHDVETLLALADIARLSGHPTDAVMPLSRVVREHPGDPRAALSAFTLGRLELDSLGLPTRAAASFQTALDLGLGAPLVEDAQARIVEALARAGDGAGALSAAAAYERRFPNGRRKGDVLRWVRAK